MVKICDALFFCTALLENKVANPRSESQIIASFVTGKTKLELLVHKDMEIADAIFEKIRELCMLRASGKPMAYITGTKEFMSLEFSVNENVLIPRPETEELVQLVLDECADKSMKVLDLCTGSGAIACSVAYYAKSAFCIGVDICPDAIKTAKLNAQKLGTENKTFFLVSDVLLPMDLSEKFDILVSNPPYIETEVIATLDTDVKNHEPHLALDGGEDGLLFYRKIIEYAPQYLRRGGLILFEIGYNQGEEVKKLLSRKFSDIQIIKDLSGHDRIAKARL